MAGRGPVPHGLVSIRGILDVDRQLRLRRRSEYRRSADHCKLRHRTEVAVLGDPPTCEILLTCGAHAAYPKCPRSHGELDIDASPRTCSAVSAAHPPPARAGPQDPPGQGQHRPAGPTTRPISRRCGFLALSKFNGPAWWPQSAGIERTSRRDSRGRYGRSVLAAAIR